MTPLRHTTRGDWVTPVRTGGSHRRSSSAVLEQNDRDLLHDCIRVLAQVVMETEVSGQIGAAPYERNTECTA